MLKKHNLFLLFLPIMLYSLGFVTLLSNSRELIRSHTVFFLAGYLIYLLFSWFDYSLLKYIWRHIYVCSVLLLMITYMFAEFRSGSARWLELGPVNFQTSEFAKLALVIALAGYLSENSNRIYQLKTLVTLLGFLFPMLVFVFIQPDLGTSMVLCGIFMGVVFYAGLSKWIIIYFLLFMGIISNPLWNLLEDYQKKRILVFLNPKLDVLGSGYNVIQSIIAVGSGGLMGKGFGRGTQANLQFLPAYWTDFIFASFAEEWGFLGVFVMLTLFFILMLVVIQIAYKVEDSFGSYLCVGIFLIYFIQLTVNIGMNLGLMPVTGVTLPFISYGGSSMLFSFIGLGLVYNVWQKEHL